MFKTMLIGHIGADATSQVLQSGKTVINFSVAVTKRYRDQAGNVQEKTTWVGVSYWPSSTNLMPYLKKGTQVFCEGEISARPYTKNDGKLDAAINLNASAIQLLASKKEAEQTVPTVAGFVPGTGADETPF